MVSIIIPAYNRANDLRQALYSVLAQTSKDYKVIVCDDCSTEDLVSICNEFKDLMDITYLCNPKNGGPGVARQLGLDYLREYPTEYLMFLDSDDALYPNAVERLKLAITEDEADIIVTDILVDSQLPVMEIKEAGKNRTWLHGKIYRTSFVLDNYLKFPPLRTNEDLGFNLIAYAKADSIYNMHEILYLWRDNKESITRKNKQSETVRRCSSTDFIETVYYAYKRIPKLDTLLMNTIFRLYESYERGYIYGYIEPKHNKQINEMLHDKQIMKFLLQLDSGAQLSTSVEYYVWRDDSLIFFPHTYGAWLNQFIKPTEIQQLLKEDRNAQGKLNRIEDKETFVRTK